MQSLLKARFAVAIQIPEFLRGFVNETIESVGVAGLLRFSRDCGQEKSQRSRYRSFSPQTLIIAHEKPSWFSLVMLRFAGRPE
jgi:hypothetical protein